MRIVYWENIVSPHKLPYWQHLASSEKVSEFILVVEENLSDELEKQGWQVDNAILNKMKLIIKPSDKEMNEILEKDRIDSYHIFSGIRAVPLVFKAFELSLQYKDLNRILLTERVNLYGIRKITRRLATIFIERKYLKHYQVVLGSGSRTKEWYLECGVKPPNFYPFLYSIFYPKHIDKKEKATQTMKFVYVGRLIQLKGLDVLFKSLSRINELDWTLDLYGDHSNNEHYLELVKELNIEKKVFFKGVKENNHLKEELSQYDLLILPSKREGWGAVVNEAISAGVKVVCSDRCGASILLCDPKIGSVFPNENHKALAKILTNEITNKDQIDKQFILDYSLYLKGEKVAEYLIKILDYHFNSQGSRPLPPWDRFIRKNKSRLN